MKVSCQTNCSTGTVPAFDFHLSGFSCNTHSPPHHPYLRKPFRLQNYEKLWHSPPFFIKTSRTSSIGSGGSACRTPFVKVSAWELSFCEQGGSQNKIPRWAGCVVWYERGGGRSASQRPWPRSEADWPTIERRPPQTQDPRIAANREMRNLLCSSPTNPSANVVNMICIQTANHNCIESDRNYLLLFQFCVEGGNSLILNSKPYTLKPIWTWI